MKLNCPACGAEVIFKSKASVFGVCSFCSSTLVRQDMNIEAIGKMSEMPIDMSPLQIGSMGVFENSKFEVVGRQRMGWENGAWNEWFLFFDNGKEGWLSDAQGFYLISYLVPEASGLPNQADLKISKKFNLNKFDFTVEDMREVSCISSEGELPNRSVTGRKVFSVDLVGENEKYANIVYSKEDQKLFIGRYMDFEKLKFLNLREIDGW